MTKNCINNQVNLIDGDLDHFCSLNKTKKIKYIQDLIKDVPLDIEFGSNILSYLLNNHHYIIQYSNHDLSRFMKRSPTIGHAGYDFCAWFDSIEKWHRISWRSSITGQSSFEQQFAMNARDYISHILREYKSRHEICERCKNKKAIEVDHVNPEFKDMIDKALDKVSEQDKHDFILFFDFFSEEKSWIPKSHASIQYILDCHKNAEFMAVCKECHKLNAKERKINAAKVLA